MYKVGDLVQFKDNRLAGKVVYQTNSVLDGVTLEFLVAVQLSNGNVVYAYPDNLAHYREIPPESDWLAPLLDWIDKESSARQAA